MTVEIITGDAGRLRHDRICAWCLGPIDPAARRDALTCSKACRQAKSRFRVGPAGEAAQESMVFSYADPPYPGMARKYYGCEEVDHKELIARMCREYPDGWALSTASSTLQMVLEMCPKGVRIPCWVKGRQASVAWFPSSAWEPLIVYRGRPRRIAASEDLCDALVWGGRQHSHPGAIVGMKPAAYCEWMFRQLGALRGDTLDDLFPGSGAIGRAWELYIQPGSSDGSGVVSAGGSNGAPGGRDTSAVATGDGSPRGNRDGYRGDVSTQAAGDVSDGVAGDMSCLAGANRRLTETLDRNRDQ